MQQPFGQEVASQTHPLADLLHSSPVLQAAHTVPDVPHVLLFWLANGRHAWVAVSQHPLHVEPPQVQAPFEQVWLFEHALHAAPAVPHELVDWLA